MTTNYHTAISTGAAANAATLNSPLAQLDAAVTAIASGGDGITQLNLDTETELTIASGAITVTRSRHTVDTEADAATDTLTDILGGAAGDFLTIRIANASRTVIVDHNAAKIFLSGRQDITLDSTLMQLTLMCVDGTIWAQVDPGLPLAVSANNSLYYPRDLAVTPSLAARNRFWVKAAAATVSAVGTAAPTVTGGGGVTAANQTDSTYINILSNAIASNVAAVDCATFNLVRRSHNPTFECVLRTDAAADLLAIRFVVGFCSVAPPNDDNFVGDGSFAVVRYSTVAGDGGWVPLTCDNATQNVGSPIVAIATTTRYHIKIAINDAAGTATFTVNGTSSTLSANLPAAATELGYNVRCTTTDAAAKNWMFSRLSVEYD